MSEERDVENLKKELKELIDRRIEYNNGFANLLCGDYSLFLSLIALILSVYGAWKLGFLARHYVLSVYLMFGIWLLYGTIDPIKRALKRAPGEKVREDLNKLRGFMTHFRGIILKILNWAFKVARPMIYSLWMLFFLCIVVLLFLAILIIAIMGVHYAFLIG